MPWPPPSYTVLRKSSPSASFSLFETEEHLSPSYREDCRCIINSNMPHIHLVKILPIQLQSWGPRLISSSQSIHQLSSLCRAPSLHSTWRPGLQLLPETATYVPAGLYKVLLYPYLRIYPYLRMLFGYRVSFSLITNCFLSLLWLTWCLKTCYLILNSISNSKHFPTWSLIIFRYIYQHAIWRSTIRLLSW